MRYFLQQAVTDKLEAIQAPSWICIVQMCGKIKK